MKVYELNSVTFTEFIENACTYEFSVCVCSKMRVTMKNTFFLLFPYKIVPMFAHTISPAYSRKIAHTIVSISHLRKISHPSEPVTPPYTTIESELILSPFRRIPSRTGHCVWKISNRVDRLFLMHCSWIRILYVSHTFTQYWNRRVHI